MGDDGQGRPFGVSAGDWPALDAILAAAPPRAPSLIVTVYGDAVLPRGGSLALRDLLTLMGRLGATEGMVRTAVSRLSSDGMLLGSRVGRHSAYALSENAREQFNAAIPRIYGEGDPDHAGTLHLAFPPAGLDRSLLDEAGFAVLAPGVMAGTMAPPAGVPGVVAVADAGTLRGLSARAWPVASVAALYQGFLSSFSGLSGSAPSGLDAMAARIALIHAFRRVALRDPHLPGMLLPEDWPGYAARSLCLSLYAALAPMSEEWLDTTNAGPGPMPRGPDPVTRFSGGDRRPSAPAS